MFSPEPYTFDRVIRISLHICLFAFVIWLVNSLSAAIIPLAVGLLLAYLLSPLVNMVQLKLKNRGLAVVVTLIGIGLLITLIVMIITPMISKEADNMARIAQEFSSNADWKQRVTQILPNEVWDGIHTYATEENINELTKLDNLVKISGKVTERLLPEAFTFIQGATGFIFGIIGLGIIIIYLFFLLIDFEAIRRTWQSFLPAPYRPKIVRIVTDFDHSMSHYFRAQAIVSGILSVLYMIGFSLIGLPLGILLGLLFGLLSMVPYLQLLGLIPAFILAVFAALDSGSSFSTMLMLTGGTYIAIQMTQELILTPRIMGQALGLRPALIIFSLSVWGQLLGLLGLIIALPLTQLLISYYKQYLDATNTDSTATS